MTGSSASRVHFDPQRSGRRTAAASCEYGLIALETSEAMSLAMAVAQSISFRALKNNQICWSTGTCIPSLSSSLARCSGEFKQIVTTSAVFSHCSQTYSSTLNTSKGRFSVYIYIIIYYVIYKYTYVYRNSIHGERERERGHFTVTCGQNTIHYGIFS